jgi:hypothetical protein
LQPLSPQWSATSAALNRQLRESSKRTVSRDEASSSSPDFALAIEESDSSVTTKERTKSKERFNGSRNGIEAIPKTLLKNGSRPPRARQDKPVDPGFIQALKDNSPGIEVEDEIRKMRRWLLDRPGRKLTRKFAIAWINRIKPETPTASPTNGQSACHPKWRAPETPEEKEARIAREEAYARQWMKAQSSPDTTKRERE